jgi:hypothetical protein
MDLKQIFETLNNFNSKTYQQQIVDWTCGRRKVTGRSPPSHKASREKPRRVDPDLSPDLRGDTGLDGCDRRRASQFNPAIGKERKLINNLR